jgi:voltage-gated potassium channel
VLLASHRIIVRLELARGKGNWVKPLVRFFNDISNVLWLYAGLLLVAAIFYDIFEGKTFFDSLWWAVVTAMTVGYGDLYPATWGGRIVGIILMHAMIFVIGPLIIGQVASRMIVDHDAFTHDEQEEIKRLLKTIAQQTQDE